MGVREVRSKGWKTSKEGEKRRGEQIVHQGERGAGKKTNNRSSGTRRLFVRKSRGAKKKSLKFVDQ